MKRIGILTGGVDVPGLNAAIKSFVWRLENQSHEVLGLWRGWASLQNIIPDPSADNSGWILPLNRVNLMRSGASVVSQRYAAFRWCHLRPRCKERGGGDVVTSLTTSDAADRPQPAPAQRVAGNETLRISGSPH